MIGATGAPTLDHTDHSSATTEEEITHELVQQLEASTDDDEDDDDHGSYDAGDAGFSPPAAWQALQYATYMTGTYQFVKEKHRAQGYLATELARAEDEMAAEGGDGPVKRPTLEVKLRYFR